MPVSYPAPQIGGSVSITGTVATSEVNPANSVVTVSNASLTNITLAASNAARRGLYIFNDSTANLLLKLGAVATASSFTIKIAAGGFYEIPQGPIYTGQIDGLWDVANGAARVTELS